MKFRCWLETGYFIVHCVTTQHDGLQNLERTMGLLGVGGAIWLEATLMCITKGPFLVHSDVVGGG